MRTLAERDVKDLLSVVADLAVLDDLLPFPPHLLRRVGELMGGADVSYSVLDRARQRSMFQAGSDGFQSDASTDGEDREFFRLVGEHPLCSRRTRYDEWTSVLKVSDFSSQRDFERTEIWNELYRGEEVRYWMDVGIAPTGSQTRMFIFTRGNRDFDERDRLVLELLQPHLQRRHDHTSTAAESADALATLEEGRADNFYDVVLCSEGGVVEFASRRSRHLLATYWGSENGSLPPGLRAALRGSSRAVSADRDGRRLIVRAARSAGMLLLLLGERDARLDRLTPRQLEILQQIASGATDAAAGAVLGVAATTVKKHLEQIYERLGVHTRTAASAVFLSQGTGVEADSREPTEVRAAGGSA
jgi:DNA-binding CsgD family transcriptional regulator